MKRFLSVLLSVLMVLSTVSFAAPSMADTAYTVDEPTEVQIDTDDASVSEEAADQGIYDEKYGLLVAKVDFDNINDSVEKINTTTKIKDIGYVTPVMPEGFPEVISINHPGSNNTTLYVEKDADGEGKHGRYELTKAAGYPKLGFEGRNADNNAEQYFPQGTYTIKVTYKAISTGDPAVEATSIPGISGISFYNNKSGVSIGERYDNTIGGYGFNNNTITNGTVSYVTATTTRLNTDDVTLRKDTPSFKFAGFSHILTMVSVNTGTPRVFEVDDIALYYKSPVTVSFTSGGVENVTLPEAICLKAGGTVDFSKLTCASTSDKLFNGWVDQNGNTLAGNVTVNEDLTVSARWEDAYGEYGILVASVDFERYALGVSANTRTTIKTVGASPSVFPEGFPTDITFNAEQAGNGATYLIAGDSKNKYVNITSTGNNSSGKWQRVAFRANGGEFPEGEYTLFFETRFDTDTTKNENVASFSATSTNSRVVLATLGEKDRGFGSVADITPEGDTSGWKKARATTSVLSGELVGFNGNNGVNDAFVSFKTFEAMPTLSLKDTTQNFKSSIFMDNIKLYYRAPIKVTFDANGKDDVAVPESVKVKYGTSLINLSSYALASDDANFLGWAYSENGDVIAANNTAALKEDTTLYAIWTEIPEEHERYGKPLFSLDFENASSWNNGDKITKFGYVDKTSENYNLWSINAEQLLTGSTKVYAANKDGQIIYINGEKQVSDDITDYTVANKFIGFNGSSGAYKYPQIQIKSNTGDFAPEGYLTLLVDSTYDLGDESVNIPNTFNYQFRPTSYYTKDGTTHSSDNVYFKSSFIVGTAIKENEFTHRIACSTKDLNSYTLTVSGVKYPVESHTSTNKILVNYEYAGSFPYTKNGVTQQNGNADIFMFDNVSLYWKPYTVSLTIDANGNDAFTCEPISQDTETKVNIFELTKEYVNSFYNGKVFKGVSLTADGEIITEDFYVTKDTTLYAVWSDDISGTAPRTYTVNSIRTDKYSGIRFLASLQDSQRNAAAEYGFIVTRKSILNNLNLDNTALSFDMPANTFVYGAAYAKDGDIDYIFDIDGAEYFFTGVVVGIPATAANYGENLVARPYIKYTDGTIYYGSAHERSVLSVAESIRDRNFTDENGEPMSDKDIAAIKNILDICGVKSDNNQLVNANGNAGNYWGALPYHTGSTRFNNSTTQIVTDPLDENNLVYLVTATSDGMHTYFEIPGMNFEAGATYKVTYRILQYDKDFQGKSVTDPAVYAEKDFVTSGCANFSYPSSKGGDHTTASFTDVTTTEWQSAYGTITILDDYDSTQSHAFGIFITPKAHIGTTAKVSRGFYLDDLVITKID